jgi:hypothetical protein
VAPFGLPVPFKVAVVEVTLVAAVVVTTGAASVVKVCSDPKRVPSEFWAMAQNQYCVDEASPVSAWLKGVGAEPAPSDVPPVAGNRVPKVSSHASGLVDEYRNQPVVADRFGVAEPLSVAVDPNPDDAALVTTAGGPWVAKLNTVPKLVPTAFSAMAQ